MGKVFTHFSEASCISVGRERLKHFIDDKSHSIFHYMFTTTHTEVSNDA